VHFPVPGGEENFLEINTVRTLESDQNFLFNEPASKEEIPRSIITLVGWFIRSSGRALLYLIQAWRLRKRENPTSIKLPPVAAHCPLPYDKVVSLEAWLMEVIRLVILRRKHLCFYRSFALASVFRELGVPVALNIGLRQLFNGGQVAGHCWLSLNGKPFLERKDPQAVYPFSMGVSNEGVRYFVGE
jgi:hypothetical protein